MVVSTINFFGNHLPIYQAAGHPGDRHHAGHHRRLHVAGRVRHRRRRRLPRRPHRHVEFATQELPKFGQPVTKVAVPWADTPPGVVCYYDLEAKPLDVLNGTEPGDASGAGTMPDLSYIGVPIKPATPDVTPQVDRGPRLRARRHHVLRQGADCWNLVDGLGRLGWTPDRSRSCCPVRASTSRRCVPPAISPRASTSSAPERVLAPLDDLEGQHLDKRRRTRPRLPSTAWPRTTCSRASPRRVLVMMSLWEMASGSTVMSPAVDQRRLRGHRRPPRLRLHAVVVRRAPEPYIAVCNRRSASAVGRREARDRQRFALRCRPRRRDRATTWALTDQDR